MPCTRVSNVLLFFHWNTKREYHVSVAFSSRVFFYADCQNERKCRNNFTGKNIKKSAIDFKIVNKMDSKSIKHMDLYQALAAEHSKNNYNLHLK
jgi:hypothetical protein